MITGTPSVHLNAMRQNVPLDELREAILKRRVATFIYEGVPVRAEPHILGYSRRTKAIVLLAYALEGFEGWKLFRYALISDFDFLNERIGSDRPACDNLARMIMGVDTRCPN